MTKYLYKQRPGLKRNYLVYRGTEQRFRRDAFAVVTVGALVGPRKRIIWSARLRGEVDEHLGRSRDEAVDKALAMAGEG